jgi:hypothetical protein
MRQEPYGAETMTVGKVTSYSKLTFMESDIRRMRGVRGYPYKDFDYDIIV